MLHEWRQGLRFSQKLNGLLPDLLAFVGAVEDIVFDHETILVGEFIDFPFESGGIGGGVCSELVHVLADVVGLAGDLADLSLQDYCGLGGLIATHRIYMENQIVRLYCYNNFQFKYTDGPLGQVHPASFSYQADEI